MLKKFLDFLTSKSQNLIPYTEELDNEVEELVQVIVLSEEDAKIFLDAIEHPPKPSLKLQAAAAKWRASCNK